jgi:hypothetical protein
METVFDNRLEFGRNVPALKQLDSEFRVLGPEFCFMIGSPELLVAIGA